MTMMSNPTGMIQGRNLLSSMNLILGATSMVTDVSCVFAGPPDPVNGVTPPLTVDEERRLNCRPISPTVQVLLIIPQVFLERTRSSPAPTYQPVLLLFCPQVLVTARALQSVKKPLPRLLLNPTKPPLKNTILPLPHQPKPAIHHRQRVPRRSQLRQATLQCSCCSSNLA